MNWLDFTLIGVIAMGTLFGIITGPLWQIYRISSVALSVAVALLLHKLLSSIIKEIFNPKVSSILGYAVTFGIILVVTYAIGNLFRRFLTKRKFGISGRLIGGGISFTKTVITCCMIIAGVSFWGNDQTRETIDNSLIAKNLDKGTKTVIPLFPQEIKDMAITEKKVSEEKEIIEEKQK
jgi:uncharacterized membrane protein required for colicin V production